ncbi:MAG: enoyl-CoA hydratase [Alphaproteobacteria bacterium]|jgi:enoyl-CoA hydratase/carnithine racemase|nr:enoyl-CoA hydratase [Alphaproteobacteria bacterium]
METETAAVHTKVVDRGAAGRVARITIDYERKLNSLTRDLMAQIVAAFEAVAGDEALRCVVLTGAGDKAFVGGANLQELATLNVDAARDFITWVHRVCHAVRVLPVPVIARVNGYCLGAGLELAAACDLRIASANAVFAMPEVKVGLPSVVEAALLPRLVGWGKAAEIVYLARNYDADEALAMGLVERVVPGAELDQAVEEWLDDLLAAGPRAIRLQKALLAKWESEPLEAAIEAGIESLASAYETDEPERLIRPFLDRKSR